jgi:hypothetical protein
MFLFLSRSGPRQVWRGAPYPRFTYVRSPLDAVTLHGFFAEDTRERYPRYAILSVSLYDEVTELAVYPHTKLARVHPGPPTHELELINKSALSAAMTTVPEGPIRDTDGDSPCT